MGSKREISLPLGSQTPQMLKWKESLRSLQRGTYMRDTPTMSKSTLLRKSTGNLAASLNSMTSTGKLNKTSGSADLERIESEYIKNLQQQVYFLELEANYLREQARKATDMHPQMTHEAERMLRKLREMQSEVDTLNMEVKQRESTLDMTYTEKDRILNRLKSEEDSHAREKRLLLDEVVQMKKEKELQERDNERKNNQVLMARQEMDKMSSSLRNAETKVQMLNDELEKKGEQFKLVSDALEEKRTEMLKMETSLREMEDKYYSSTATIQDKVVQDLRDEIRALRQKLKETEMSADQDRYLRTKLSDDSAHLVKENALLNQQVLELTKQLERERSLREGQDSRRTQSITEMVVIKDREKQLKFELEQAREMLSHEQERVRHYMEQLAKQEQVTTSQELNATTTRSRLTELETRHHSTDTENNHLRRDKVLLVDHVADLQKQLDEQERENFALRSRTRALEQKMGDLGHLKEIEATVQSQKWEEFARLAESMKSLTTSMSHTTNGATLEYS